MRSSTTVGIGIDGRVSLRVRASPRRLVDVIYRIRADVKLVELFSAVQASLRNKVADLDEDRWMYEGEEEEGSG